VNLPIATPLKAPGCCHKARFEATPAAPKCNRDRPRRLLRRRRTHVPATLRFILGDLQADGVHGSDRRRPSVGQRSRQRFSQRVGVVAQLDFERVARPRRSSP